MSGRKRIPISHARQFAEEHGLDRIVILATTPEGVTWITTWGETREKCAESARAQEFWNGGFRDFVLPPAAAENIEVAK